MTTPTIRPKRPLCRICGEHPATSPDYPGICRWESCERAADLEFEAEVAEAARELSWRHPEARRGR